jgi:hypothetical protein
MKPIVLVVLAVALVALRLFFSVSGIDAHACVVSGMASSDASIILGPVAVLVALATPILAPILVIASASLVAASRVRRSTP